MQSSLLAASCRPTDAGSVETNTSVPAWDGSYPLETALTTNTTTICRGGVTMQRLFAILLCLIATAVCDAAAPAQRRPNILFIYADDQSAKTVSCYEAPTRWPARRTSTHWLRRECVFRAPISARGKNCTAATPTSSACSILPEPPNDRDSFFAFVSHFARPRPVARSTRSTRRSRGPSANWPRASSIACSCRPRRTMATRTASPPCWKSSIPSGFAGACRSMPKCWRQ